MNDLSYSRVGDVDLCTSCPDMNMIPLGYAHRICTVVFWIIIRCEIYPSHGSLRAWPPLPHSRSAETCLFTCTMHVNIL